MTYRKRKSKGAKQKQSTDTKQTLILTFGGNNGGA